MYNKFWLYFDIKSFVFTNKLRDKLTIYQLVIFELMSVMTKRLKTVWHKSKFAS